MEREEKQRLALAGGAVIGMLIYHQWKINKTLSFVNRLAVVTEQLIDALEQEQVDVKFQQIIENLDE